MVATQVLLVLFTLLLFLCPSTFQQSGQPPLRSRVEWSALLQLRSSLGLRARDWPLKRDPCSVWVGVQCRNGTVVGINISGFRRTRIATQNPQFAVDALANFSSLASFNASRFSLPGSIPTWLGQQVSSLQVLDLRSCSIVGAIPSSLGNLTSLTALYLSRNSITGTIPSSLVNLSRLSVLDLSENSITGMIPLSFTFLVNLTLLDISSNYLSGTVPPAIGNLSMLQFLNLSSNSLSSSIPPQLGDLSNLVDLDLSLNSFSGSVPSDLRGLRNLQVMVMGNNLLTGPLPDSLFSPLTQLHSLVLSQNDFTGALPDVLWSMPGLRLLDASSNNFTGILPNLSLNANTSTGSVFNLSNNMFYGVLTPILRRFSGVDLSDNYFQGVVPDYVGSSVSLRRNCLRSVSNQKNVEDCASFYAGRGLPFDNFGQPNRTQPPPPRAGRRSNRRLIIILAGVLGGVLLILILVTVLALLIFCNRRRGSTTQRGTGVGPVPASENPPPPGVSLNLSTLGEAFTYQQLLLATADFSDLNLIKLGHSGDIFQGTLEGGVSVVIKKTDLSSGKKDYCMQELDFFSKVSHTRLVPLLGHCLENESEKFLIYKYMPNGDLSSSLYRKSTSDDDSLQSLDWITRLKIATGAAEGLSYLHHECNPPLVHRDVQASSILLDDKFEVRLGSLSEVCPQEVDAQSKRFTRLLRLPQTSEQGASGSPTATCAYDVYCFGKVLLELVTGKLGISSASDATTKDLLEGMLPYISIYDKDLVTNIVDPSLIIDEDLLEEVWAMAVVARSCLNPKPARRPLMRYILKALENPLKVVREENSGSSRLRTTSSRGSWNAALFGSWRHSSSDVAAIPSGGGPSNRGEVGSSFKQSRSTGSQGSGQNGGNGNDHSSSARRHSKDIFPEPLDEHDVERSNED